MNWKCEVQEQAVPLTIYIMWDIDLTVQVILGIVFPLKSRMILDFSRAHYSLPTEEGNEEANSFPSRQCVPFTALLPCNNFSGLQ